MISENQKPSTFVTLFRKTCVDGKEDRDKRAERLFLHPFDRSESRG